MSKTEEQPNSQSTPLRILIADDVPETRRSTRLMMTLVPNTKVVAIAHDGRQAVEMTKTHRPDIAVMDVQMPGLDGLAAIEQMLQHQPDMACIVISAERNRTTLRRAMRAGARDYLIKPFTSDQLVDVMERVGRILRENRRRITQTTTLTPERRAHLTKLATELIRTRRTDDKALAVLEELAADPECETRWLMSLTLIYVFRQQWGKLKKLAARLEQQSAPE